jgi:hypothetical protein
MHGKDISIPKGIEITAYVNEDMRLDRSGRALLRSASGSYLG